MRAGSTCRWVFGIGLFIVGCGGGPPPAEAPPQSAPEQREYHEQERVQESGAGDAAGEDASEAPMQPRAAAPATEGAGDYEQVEALHSQLMSVESDLERALPTRVPDCDSARHHKDQICDLAERICDLVEDVPNTVGRCQDGRQRCARAREKFASRCGE